jgi:hypothetical protein
VIIASSFQRLALCATRRSEPFKLSIGLVVASVRRSVGEAKSHDCERLVQALAGVPFANIVLALERDGEVTPKLFDVGVAKVPAAGDRAVGRSARNTPLLGSPHSNSRCWGRTRVRRRSRARVLPRGAHVIL